MDHSLDELLALIHLTEDISARLRGVTSEDEIIDTVVGSFRRSHRFRAHLIMQNEHGDELRFVGTSFPSSLVRLGEVVAGVSIDTFRIDPEKSPLLRRVWKDGLTVRASTTEALADFLPSPIVPKILRRMGYEGTYDFLTPLHRGTNIVGVLSVTAPDLADHFIPSLQSLAHHIGASLDFVNTRQALFHTEHRYRDLVENLNEIFFVTDAAGRITYITPNVAILGLQQEALAGEPLNALFARQDPNPSHSDIRRLSTDGAAASEFDLAWSSDDGSKRWLRLSGRPVVEDGQVVGLRGSIIDVTDLKTAEMAHRESERQLLTLMSNLPGMAYRGTGGPDRSITFVSEGALRLTGYAPEDLINGHPLTYENLIHPDDKASLRAEVGRGLRLRRPFELTYRITTLDGQQKWVWEQGQGVFTEAGHLDAIEGFVTDVTEQRRIAEELRRNEERLSLALESISDGLADWHIPSGTAYFNARYYTMLGFEPDELTADLDSWEWLLHPDEREAVMKTIREHGERSDERLELELRMRTKDGSWRWILVRVRVVERDETGLPLRVIGTHTDITARKEDAAALQRTLTGTIRAVARTAEVRDPYTAGHQERVALLASAIAAELDCPPTAIRALHAAGLLHDVGKIAVPSEILSKPGTLTKIETDLVRGHVEAGCQILAEIEFPWPVARIVREHHERLDGTGYPRGLMGEAISFEARILAVADVVESMSSHRPYRPTLGERATFEELRSGRGSRYDPNVVDACLRVFRERGFTFEGLSVDAASLFS